jgi:O-antigen/teichoic acid export membrane protein
LQAFPFRKAAVVLTGMLGAGLWRLVAVWGIARWLGPEIQGAFSLFLASSTFGAIVCSLGFEYANAFVAGRFPERRNGVVANTLLTAGALLLLSPVLGYLQIALLPQIGVGLLPDQKLLSAILVGVATVLLSLQQGLQSAAIGSELYSGIARNNIVSGGLWAGGALAAVHWGFLWVLGAWCLALIAGSFLHLWRLVGASWDVRPDSTAFRAQLGFGLRTLPGSVARALNMRGGLYMATSVLAPAQVGVYGLVLTLAEVLLYVPSALSQVVLGTAASRPEAAGGHRALARRVLVVGAVGVLLVVTLGSPLLGAVFGEAYRSGAPPLAILVAAVTFHSIGLLYIHHRYGSGDPGGATKAQLVTLLLTLLLVPSLVPRWGMVGAASASLFAYAGFASFLVLSEGRAARAVTAP